jgi:endo-1,4-beta-mannosidase
MGHLAAFDGHLLHRLGDQGGDAIEGDLVEAEEIGLEVLRAVQPDGDRGRDRAGVVRSEFLLNKVSPIHMAGSTGISMVRKSIIDMDKNLA